MKALRQLITEWMPWKRVSAPEIRAGNERLDHHLRRLFELMEINCVLDVGANQGQYGRFLRQLGYRGKIISFEPAADDYAILKQAADRDPLWSAHEFALGDEEGVLSMNVTSDSLFNSFLQPNDFIVQQGLRVVGVKEVEVRRLDDVFDSLISDIPEPRVYLKIDTQGYELNVLYGATGVLGQMLALQAEVSVKHVYEDVPNYLEAISAMTGLGYELTGMFPIARDNALRVVEFDCVMIRASAAGESTSLHSP